MMLPDLVGHGLIGMFRRRAVGPILLAILWVGCSRQYDRPRDYEGRGTAADTRGADGAAQEALERGDRAAVHAEIEGRLLRIEEKLARDRGGAVAADGRATEARALRDELNAVRAAPETELNRWRARAEALLGRLQALEDQVWGEPVSAHGLKGDA